MKYNQQNMGQDSIGDFSLNIMLWMILPSLMSGMLQRVYYAIKYRTDAVKPSPGTAKYQRDSSRFYIFVVGTYLLFCIFQVIYTLPPNYYAEFGVAPSASERDLKGKFRKYSLQYHPDRNPTEEGSVKFMRLRKVYETLTDPVAKEAYNKFGVFRQCLNCILFKDYLWQGLMEFAGFYGGTGIVLIILNMLGQGQFGAFWRFVAYFLMAALELSWLVLPYDPLSWFLPWCTIAEKISVMHQCVIYIFIALNQFGPILFPDESKDVKAELRALESVVELGSKEAVNNLKLAFEPFVENKEMLEALKKNMQMQTVRSRLETFDPEFKAARQRIASSAASLRAK